MATQNGRQPRLFGHNHRVLRRLARREPMDHVRVDDVREMLVHRYSVPGLSDGGAHVGTICDASFPTTLLAFWGRDRVRGRFDRVDERDGCVAIIDYKSSAVRDQKEANRKAQESLQLGIYALAYEQMHGRIPDAVELHFLESSLVGSARKTETQFTEIRATIEEVARGIRARNFAARPGYLQCGYCAFREICPSTAYPEGD